MNYLPDCLQPWVTDWMHGFRGSSPRTYFASQLLYIRKAHGRIIAKRFASIVRTIASDDISRTEEEQ